MTVFGKQFGGSSTEICLIVSHHTDTNRLNYYYLSPSSKMIMMMMEAASTSETSKSFYQPTQHNSLGLNSTQHEK
jgi:hypothetical protein